MQVVRGINWIADAIPCAPAEKDAQWTRKGDRTLWLSEAFRMNYPVSKPSVYRDTDNITFSYGEKHILATHPRPYNQWIYDSMKVDIAVIAEKGELQKAKEKLSAEKELALRRKSGREEKLGIVKPLFRTLLQRGLADGIVGRGSYFDKNGYPSVKDDIDIMLLRYDRVGSKEQYDAFNDEVKNAISKSEGNFEANFVQFNEHVIKNPSGKGAQVFSFITITGDVQSNGIYYERYVLMNAKGIEIPGFPASESESVAKRMALNLSKDTRESLIKEGKLTIFPRKARR